MPQGKFWPIILVALLVVLAFAVFTVHERERAILFQLGIHYMQGHYVEEPEVVLQEPENVVHTTLEAIAGN